MPHQMQHEFMQVIHNVINKFHVNDNIGIRRMNSIGSLNHFSEHQIFRNRKWEIM